MGKNNEKQHKDVAHVYINIRGGLLHRCSLNGPDFPVYIYFFSSIRLHVGLLLLFFLYFFPRGKTIIAHNVIGEQTVPQGFEGHGSYQVDVAYTLPMDTIVAIMMISKSCRQYVRATCYNTHIYDNDGEQTAYWVSRQGIKMPNWGNAPSDVTGCLCGLNNSKFYCILYIVFITFPTCSNRPRWIFCIFSFRTWVNGSCRIENVFIGGGAKMYLGLLNKEGRQRWLRPILDMPCTALFWLHIHNAYINWETHLDWK